MREPIPEVEVGADHRAGGLGLPVMGGLLGSVAVVAFLFGLSLGESPAPPPSFVPSATPSPAIQEQAVSPALRTAYLNGANSGWALCTLAAEVSCRQISAVPYGRLANFDTLPLRITEDDWTLLKPATVASAHYILAGPVTGLEPELTLARVSNEGVGTLVGPNTQVHWGGRLWADLGDLHDGRYLAVTMSTDLSYSDVEHRFLSRRLGWASAFIVGAHP